MVHNMADPVTDQQTSPAYAAEIERIDALIREADEYIRSSPDRLQELAGEIAVGSTFASYKRGTAYAEFYTGCVLYLRADAEKSIPHYTVALQILSDIGDKSGACGVLRYLGLANHALCRYEQALGYYQRELDIRKQYADPIGTAGTLTNIATMYLLTGRHDEALQYYLQSLTALGDRQEHRVYTATLSNIANLYMSLGEYETAMEHQHKVLAIYRRQGDETGEANTLLNMGWNYNHCGEYAQALECGGRALELYDRQNNIRKKAIALLYLGQTYSHLEQYDEAFALFKQSYKTAHDIGDKKNCTDILRSTGDMLVLTGDDEQARTYYRSALAVAREIELRQMEYELHEVLAQLEERTGNAEAALQYYREYIRIKEDVLNERRRQAVSELQIRFDVDQAEKEKEIYRLKNVELAEALEKVEMLNHNLSEADNEKNELMGIVAHDLKNPISGLAMSLSMLKDYLPRMSQEDIVHQIDQMNGTVVRMEQIVARLLDLNMLESGALSLQPSVFDLNEAILAVMNDYAERMKAKNITAQYRLHPEPVPVYADKGSTLEILDNLISNAIKYSPYDTVVTVRSSPADTMASVAVQDSGPGITVADQARLFRKFTRLSTRPTGGESSTGLGLSIVKKLADAMQGRVRCESEPGKGATFIVELPAAV